MGEVRSAGELAEVSDPAWPALLDSIEATGERVRVLPNSHYGDPWRTRFAGADSYRERTRAKSPNSLSSSIDHRDNKQNDRPEKCHYATNDRKHRISREGSMTGAQLHTSNSSVNLTHHVIG